MSSYVRSLRKARAGTSPSRKRTRTIAFSLNISGSADVSVHLNISGNEHDDADDGGRDGDAEMTPAAIGAGPMSGEAGNDENIFDETAYKALSEAMFDTCRIESTAEVQHDVGELKSAFDALSIDTFEIAHVAGAAPVAPIDAAPIDEKEDDMNEVLLHEVLFNATQEMEIWRRKAQEATVYWKTLEESAMARLNKSAELTILRKHAYAIRRAKLTSEYRQQQRLRGVRLPYEIWQEIDAHVKLKVCPSVSVIAPPWFFLGTRAHKHHGMATPDKFQAEDGSCVTCSLCLQDFDEPGWVRQLHCCAIGVCANFH